VVTVVEGTKIQGDFAKQIREKRIDKIEVIIN